MAYILLINMEGIAGKWGAVSAPESESVTAEAQESSGPTTRPAGGWYSEDECWWSSARKL